MILHHFTSTVHLPRIFDAGHLRCTESNLHPITANAGPDVVWFTTMDTPALGHGLSGSIVDKSEVRFTVDVPDNWVRPWLPWAEAQGIDAGWLSVMVEAGGGREAAESWRVTFRPVRSDRWVAVDRRTPSGLWVPVGDAPASRAI